MKCYLVGGAVRDKLLGISIYDKDYCVVGSSIPEMIGLGFQQVGKDFPVFLHPITREEYALARTERKNGVGYKGFICDFNANITLEEDLIRRDLTVNAIAMDEDGNIFDPYNGQKDLKNKILRHVSSAFSEDPLRVLRLARFYAKYKHLGFTVANETLELCKQMVLKHELDHLTPERIWQELHKALLTKNPEVFFTFLAECNALSVILPEIDSLRYINENPEYHPEGNTFAHTMLTLKSISSITNNPKVRFSMLTHDLGKIATASSSSFEHAGHRSKAKPFIQELCNRLRVPNTYTELAHKIALNHTYVDLTKRDPKYILNIFNSMDAYRSSINITYLAQCITADFRGRDCNTPSYFFAPYELLFMFVQTLKVNIKEIIDLGFKNKEIKDELDRRRIQKIKEAQITLNSMYHKD